MRADYIYCYFRMKIWAYTWRIRDRKERVLGDMIPEVRGWGSGGGTIGYRKLFAIVSHLETDRGSGVGFVHWLCHVLGEKIKLKFCSASKWFESTWKLWKWSWSLLATKALKALMDWKLKGALVRTLSWKTFPRAQSTFQVFLMKHSVSSKKTFQASSLSFKAAKL